MNEETYQEILDRLRMIESQSPALKIAFTVQEVAVMLNISRSTIARAIRKGQLRPSRLGDWRITQDQLNEWLELRWPVKGRRK